MNNFITVSKIKKDCKVHINEAGTVLQAYKACNTTRWCCLSSENQSGLVALHEKKLFFPY